METLFSVMTRFANGEVKRLDIKAHPENPTLARFFVDDQYLFVLDEYQLGVINSRIDVFITKCDKEEECQS